jgi:predicted MFS family arabinose efflux permease
MKMIFQYIKTFDMQIEAMKHVNLKLYLPIFGSLSLGTNCGSTFAINSTSCRLSCHVNLLKIISAIFLNFCRNVPWIPEPSVNNKLKHREGSGSTGGFFD